MSHNTILLVEDDLKLGMILKAFFDANGFTVTLCQNGEEALNTYRSSLFDICITNVMMPGMDGFTLAQQIKRTNPTFPIIFLTAQADQEDILKAFQIGCEDYVTKPFSMDELLARVKVWQRWSGYIQLESHPSVYHIGSFMFDAPRHLLTCNNETKKLTTKEADLLLLLCENNGNTLERSKALQQIWKEASYLNARTMDVYITKLRKYLKEDPKVEIQNVHGVGFRLVVK